MTLSVLRRATHAAVLVLAIVVVLCTIAVILGMTYGILHRGDDFDSFDGSRGGALFAMMFLGWLIVGGYASTRESLDLGGFGTGAGLADIMILPRALDGRNLYPRDLDLLDHRERTTS